MWEIEIRLKDKYAQIDILLNKVVILREEYLSVYTDEKESTLFYGNAKKYTSYLWEFVKSMYKEFVQYRKYGDIDDLGISSENNIERYYHNALVSIEFSEEFVDNVIFEIENLRDKINGSPLYKYEHLFVL